jgi:hypothetical protein
MLLPLKDPGQDLSIRWKSAEITILPGKAVTQYPGRKYVLSARDVKRVR